MELLAVALLIFRFLQPPCAVTPIDRSVPDVAGSVVGSSPAWMTYDGGKLPAEGFVKTLWIFQTRWPVRVRGQDLETGAVAQFRRGGVDGPITSEMSIADPFRESVRPGGASRDVLSVYAFIPSFVFYQRPGCYRFDVDIDGAVRKIVIQLK